MDRGVCTYLKLKEGYKLIRLYKLHESKFFNYTTELYIALYRVLTILSYYLIIIAMRYYNMDQRVRAKL
jgi:hypothetical protein